MDVKNFGLEHILAVHDANIVNYLQDKQELSDNETIYDLQNDVFVSKESY